MLIVTVLAGEAAVVAGTLADTDPSERFPSVPMAPIVVEVVTYACIRAEKVVPERAKLVLDALPVLTTTIATCPEAFLKQVTEKPLFDPVTPT